MALTYSKPVVTAMKAPEFSLKGVDEKTYSLASFKECKALVIIFMCNHCPYVIAVQDRINALAKKYASQGVGLIGINSNDSKRYADDSFENMKLRARERQFVFPYLVDDTQEVAKAYDAVCTPDPYLFENTGEGFILRYRGRIDDHWKDESQVKTQDLALAIEAVLKGNAVTDNAPPAMGCSIKWL